MRRLVDSERLRAFMRALAKAAPVAARIYLTGGASAVLLDWRHSTIDVDLKLEPESDLLLRAFPKLKEEGEINIELASPGDFIPELPGWRERSVFITREGTLDFFHYDFYGQALSKIERGHARDLADVEAMHIRRLIEPSRLQELYDAIEPELYRYPAITASVFREVVKEAVQRMNR